MTPATAQPLAIPLDQLDREALRARIAARDGTVRQRPAAKAAAKIPLCIHLGDVLAGELGKPCGHRRAGCFMHETCTFKPTDGVAHHCTDGRGNFVCEDYEPKDTP